MLIQVELHLTECHSLKEKRGVMKPLLNRLRSDFNISVAETDHHDFWQSAQLSLIAVSNLRPALESLERALEEYFNSSPHTQVSGWHKEWL